MAVMPSDDLPTRIRIASRSCPDAVSGQVFRSPAQAFADLAQSCAELGIEPQRMAPILSQYLGTQSVEARFNRYRATIER